eukprot:scaffold173477_cov32-Tisochrysis_lutea.AAC.3
MEDRACSLRPSARMPRCKCMKLGVAGVLSSRLPLPRKAARNFSGSSRAVFQIAALEITARRARMRLPPLSSTPSHSPASLSSMRSTGVRSRNSPPYLVSPRESASTTAPEPPSG